MREIRGRRRLSFWFVGSAVAAGTLFGGLAVATRATDSAQSTQMAPKVDVKPDGPRATSTSTPATPPTTSPSTTSVPPAAPTTTAAPPTTSPPVGPPAAAAVPASGVLADPSVTAYLATRPGTITAAVYDYATGQLSTYRPGASGATASIVKVHILETLLSQAQSAGRGLSASEQALATRMIEQSDNDAATDLWDEVGGAAGLNALGARIGLTDTGPDPEGYWGLTTTTASDQVVLLRNLTDPSATLDPANQAYALSLMGAVESDQTWGVSAGVAPGTTVQLKDGWLPEASGWYVNSIGVVTGSGRHYALAVLTSGDRSQDVGEDTIAGLSALVWARLAH